MPSLGFDLVGAVTKLDRDGSKLDSGDGAKLDFCGIALEATGVELISSESRASPAGYGSAGGQPERRTLPKGLMPRCCGTSYPRAATLFAKGPLAQCGKLRGFGGSAPMVEDWRRHTIAPRLPGVQRNNSFIACRPISSAVFSRISTPAHSTRPVPPPAWA